ncbi:NUDIX domain-containing protein [Solibacillus sp. A46]|uniref:NUDIX domain-containing protein n=1 Tax=Solibacillus faecavium TaxID=2762221 RepID=A0ABR8Y2K4_9BACL|nr:NUDIX domain-containing protein [Solibacillus faecavium]MBD8038448.1 NUDIX domain-containing protein [Solibacillus faecavium]
MQYKIWNGASAIVIKDNSVLMVRAKNSNSWSVPSGEVEVDETAKETCIREISEETGYEAKVVKALHTKNTIIKDYKVTTQYFLCEVTGGAIQYQDPDDEIEEISWINSSEISNIIHAYPEDQEIIEKLLLSINS